MCQGKIHLVSVWCCLNAVSQHLKGQEIHLLPICLFLFYPIKTAVLLSPLLSHSYWDPERTLHHVPVSPHPLPQWEHKLTKSNFWDALCSMGRMKVWFQSSGQQLLSLQYCLEQEEEIPHTYGGQNKTSPVHCGELKISVRLVEIHFFLAVI